MPADAPADTGCAGVAVPIAGSLAAGATLPAEPAASAVSPPAIAGKLSAAATTAVRHDSKLHCRYRMDRIPNGL